ncbi:TPA: pyrroline-5-carboxylate reductase [Candidatus Micrarchaeota archaeon]|nr:pyrroline-5-carboxylate reductase [Candidatus Micrarchaeota archaeon]
MGVDGVDAMKIAIIGVGRLGSILVGKFARTADVTAIDKEFCRLKPGAGIKQGNNISDAKNCDVIIVSVKPKEINGVLLQLKELSLGKHQLLISAAAGVPLNFIKEYSNAKRVSRIMPNVNIEVNEGFIAYCGEDVREVFGDLGVCMEIDEKHFDVLTSVSGSGPAFIWHFAKAFEEVAEQNGISEKDARMIIGQLLKGCGEMMLKTDKSLDELIATVASPGGTTEQGLKHLNEMRVNGIIAETLERAIKKAKEIGKSIG